MHTKIRCTYVSNSLSALCLLIQTFTNSLNPDQSGHFVQPNLDTQLIILKEIFKNYPVQRVKRYFDMELGMEKLGNFFSVKLWLLSYPSV